MHRRAIMALAAFALALGASAYAADGTESSDRTGASSVSGENTTPSTGRTEPGMGANTGADESSVDRSVETTNSGDTRYTDVSRTGDVDEDVDRSGARTGGYLAAGIGIAALIGLFASRRNRTRTTHRGKRYDVDDDDFNRPSGVGPRV